MYYEHNSLTSKHEITLDRLTCHKNQSIIRYDIQYLLLLMCQPPHVNIKQAHHYLTLVISWEPVLSVWFDCNSKKYVVIIFLTTSYQHDRTHTTTITTLSQLLFILQDKGHNYVASTSNHKS